LEGNFAVCLDDSGYALSLPLSYFQDKPKEGDIFEVTLTPLPTLRAERQHEIRSLFEKLKNKEKKS